MKTQDSGADGRGPGRARSNGTTKKAKATSKARAKADEQAWAATLNFDAPHGSGQFEIVRLPRGRSAKDYPGLKDHFPYEWPDGDVMVVKVKEPADLEERRQKFLLDNPPLSAEEYRAMN